MSRRMFSAPFTSALSATLHGSQTTAHVHVGHADSLFFSAGTTYLTRITFRYPSELNTLEFRPVSENRGEAVERSSVEVGVAVVAPSFLSYRCHPFISVDVLIWIEDHADLTASKTFLSRQTEQAIRSMPRHDPCGWSGTATSGWRYHTLRKVPNNSAQTRVPSIVTGTLPPGNRSRRDSHGGNCIRSRRGGYHEWLRIFAW